jgi:hypothetical protein
MRRDELTAEEARALLRKAIKAEGTLCKFALKYSMWKGTVSEMQRGKRSLSDRVMQILGLERVEHYRLINSDEED